MNDNSQKRLVRAVYQLVKRYDAKKPNPDAGLILKRIERVVATRRPLEFISFTCSTIRSEYLFSRTPWRYVRRDTRGNNLTADLPRLEEIYNAIGKIYPVRITILVGNTDPYYIYLRQFAAYPERGRKRLMGQFHLQWQHYRTNLARWIRKHGTFRDLAVISWYDLERAREEHEGIRFELLFNRVRRRLGRYFGKKDFDWELRKLKTQFGPGRYFEKLRTPPKPLLADWVRRKFAEYAIQGLWIRELFPDAILIQNEKPSDLRYKMYQPLVQEKYHETLPNVFFFGVDNHAFR